MTLIHQLITEQRHTQADVELLAARVDELNQMVADMDRRMGEQRDITMMALQVAKRQMAEKQALMVHMGYLWLAQSEQPLSGADQVQANRSRALMKEIADKHPGLLGR